MWNNFVELAKGFTGGFAVGLITPWVITTFGAQITADLKALVNKIHPTASAPIAPVAATGP
jgi:hypothetical protein